MTRKELDSLQERVLALPREQKEVLRDSLEASLAPIPDWHREVLTERIATADEGSETLSSALEVVERVRASLRRR